MADPERKPNLIRASDHEAVGIEEFTHPLNPKSRVRGLSLSRPTGLVRTGVNLLHIPPGRESFAYHSHAAEEEWIYVLAGRGVAEIDGADHEVGPGDFMGFPTPSVGHNLRNPYDEELVYLSGGEHHAVEVAEFPRLGKRMVRVGGRASIHDTASATGLAEIPTVEPPR